MSALNGAANLTDAAGRVGGGARAAAVVPPAMASGLCAGVSRLCPHRTSALRVPERLHRRTAIAVATLQAATLHPDALRRRAEAEARAKSREEGRERQRQLRSQGLKWWQEPSEHIPLLNSPEEFVEQVQSSQAAGQLMIVKFFSEECYACKSIAPKLNKLAESYTDVVFSKVNGSMPEFTSFLEEMGITGVPWFQFYRNGELVHSMSASLNPERLAAFRREIVRQRKLALEGGE